MHAQTQSQPCGSTSAGATTPLRGVLEFKEGRLSIDFKTSDQPQTLSAEFGVTNCQLATSDGLTVRLLPASEGSEIPPAAIQRTEAIAKGDFLIIQAVVDPRKLDAGKYSAKLFISGDKIASGSVKGAVSRSHPGRGEPISAVLVGVLGGLVVAAFGVATNIQGGLKTQPIFIGAAAVLAGFLGVQIYLTQYNDILVWEPTFSNWVKLALAAGTAAAGASVVALLGKGLVRTARRR